MLKFIVLATSALLAGCVSSRPVDIAKPSELSVQAAMRSVAEGLQEFRQVGLQNKANYGLIVDEVTLTLKVTASAKDSNKLVVNVADIKPAYLAPATLTANNTYEVGSEGTRDNTIIIKLKNVYTAQLNAKGLGTGVAQRPGAPGIPTSIITLKQPLVLDCANPKTALEQSICGLQKEPAAKP
ncbi:hypothetical protein [uncultured Agrobacterium sp.]|uniref:hypothetical protein n=1 Tax=uncultured Agrobacterium sp. TaxID=157277 RepID=UPI0025E0E9BD|nr:hypothetical protein [uncultured Agrobacterium sp.]